MSECRKLCFQALKVKNFPVRAYPETAELGGGGGAGRCMPQMQYLTAFLDRKVTKSCKVTRTPTKIL